MINEIKHKMRPSSTNLSEINFSYANYLLWQTVLEAYLGPSQTSMKDLLFRK